MKRQISDLKKIFAKHILDKIIAYKIYRKILNSIIRKNTNPLKSRQKLWTDTSQKKIYRWKMSMWKYERKKESKSVSCSAMSDSLQSHGL